MPRCECTERVCKQELNGVQVHTGALHVGQGW